MLDQRCLLFPHLFFHRGNCMGAHPSAAAIHLVLNGYETGNAHGAILPHMDIKHPIWLESLSDDDWKRKFYKPCVLLFHVSSILINGLGSHPHFIFQATSKQPNCLGHVGDLSLFMLKRWVEVKNSSLGVSSLLFACKSKQEQGLFPHLLFSFLTKQYTWSAQCPHGFPATCPQVAKLKLKTLVFSYIFQWFFAQHNSILTV